MSNKLISITAFKKIFKSAKATSSLMTEILTLNFQRDVQSSRVPLQSSRFEPIFFKGDFFNSELKRPF